MNGKYKWDGERHWKMSQERMNHSPLSKHNTGLLKSHGASQVCVQKENESHKKETAFACLRKELCHGLCKGWEPSQGAKASGKPALSLLECGFSVWGHVVHVEPVRVFSAVNSLHRWLKNSLYSSFPKCWELPFDLYFPMRVQTWGPRGLGSSCDGFRDSCKLVGFNVPQLSSYPSD